jgi:protein gp37
MRKEWVESIFWQRRDTGVPFFFQQWGGVRKELAGREHRGRTFNLMSRCCSRPDFSASDALSQEIVL